MGDRRRVERALRREYRRRHRGSGLEPLLEPDRTWARWVTVAALIAIAFVAGFLCGEAAVLMSLEVRP